MTFSNSNSPGTTPSTPTVYGFSPMQAGSSSVEFIIAFAALVPFFIGIPMLAKHADLKNSALQASRYAVWERTVYSGPDAPWREGEAAISDESVRMAAETRFFGHSAHGIHNRSQTENPFWNTRNSDPLLQRRTTGNPLTLTLNDSSVVDGMSGWARATARPVEVLGATGLELNGAFGSLTSKIEGGLNALGGAAGFIGNLVGQNVDCSIPGINVVGGDADGGGLGLASNNLTRATITVPLHNRVNSAGGNPVIVTHAAILANPWSAPSDPVFAKRLDNIVPNQMLGCITAPGAILFGSMGSRGEFLFGEGKYASELAIESPSNALPDEF